MRLCTWHNASFLLYKVLGYLHDLAPLKLKDYLNGHCTDESCPFNWVWLNDTQSSRAHLVDSASKTELVFRFFLKRSGSFQTSSPTECEWNVAQEGDERLEFCESVLLSHTAETAALIMITAGSGLAPSTMLTIWIPWKENVCLPEDAPFSQL